ncbi:unnamed protein product [Heligmosomoides polygyrus]|uniref:Reverse transcriptase domain-containing protein n=1 Tax=Heligmosomoides polygyrus TaxID=6339 RepID=A0A183GIH9_HELPZ|nr:unnamed protein product [Heligmosomoides polygyrus]
MDIIDKEYDRSVHNLRVCAKSADSLNTTKRRLSPETLELIRQRGAAQASGNYHLTREGWKCWLKLQSWNIRNVRRNFANFNTKMAEGEGQQDRLAKLLTRVILNRFSPTLDEGQPCEQAGFRRGFSTIDHIHTITKLIEVSREYKLPLCFAFIDLENAVGSNYHRRSRKKLATQFVPTPYI